MSQRPESRARRGRTRRIVPAFVANAEVELLLGPGDTICPSTALSEARIRELAAVWDASPACGAARGRDRLLALDNRLCAIQTERQEKVAAEGVKPWW